LKVLLAILKIRKLTPFTGSDFKRLFLWNSSLPAEALKIENVLLQFLRDERGVKPRLKRLKPFMSGRRFPIWFFCWKQKVRLESCYRTKTTLFSAYRSLQAQFLVR